MNIIEAYHIDKSFQNKQVLHQLDIEIGRGECFGCLGHSGAGKTTLLKLLTGQIKADHGESFLMGKPSEACDEQVLRRIGLVLDEKGLYERHSAFENLLLYAKLHQVKKERIMEMLKRVGLAEAAYQKVGQFSKGMKQRLVIARALLHEPQLLFLDEPVSGLDPLSAAMIHDLLLELKQQGVSIFLTTHNMNEVLLLCDRIGFLHQGHFVVSGTTEEILLAYNQKRGIDVILEDGQHLYIDEYSKHAQELYMYFKEEKIRSIHSRESTLEDIFTRLCGEQKCEI